MRPQDYTTTIRATVSTKKVIDAIDDVGAWWTTSFKGAAKKVGDKFGVRFSSITARRRAAKSPREEMSPPPKAACMHWRRPLTIDSFAVCHAKSPRPATTSCASRKKRV